MFDQQDTGRVDSAGKPIRCGDRVRLQEGRPGYRQTTTEDGWGRTVPLCSHDQREVPPREKTTDGIVIYDAQSTGFAVRFDDFLLESGNTQQPLYVLLATSSNHWRRLNVIG